MARMRDRIAIAVLCLVAAGSAMAQQEGKVASHKEQAELAQPPGTPSVQPRAPQQGPQAQRPAAKDAELRYGPSLYDSAPRTQRDAARADETDQTPRTEDAGNKQGAAQGPDAGKPGVKQDEQTQGVKKQDQKKPDQKKPVARRRSTTQDIATMPPPPPLHPAAPIAPLPPTPHAPIPSAPMPASCGPAGCLTPSGQHLNQGIGTALIAPDGRTCVRNGNTVQCN